MIHKFLKQELDRLKDLVAIENKTNHNPSYGDVIKFLVHFYKENIQSIKLPTFIIPSPKTVMKHGSVIFPKREVIFD